MAGARGAEADLGRGLVKRERGGKGRGGGKEERGVRREGEKEEGGWREERIIIEGEGELA